MAVSVEMHHTGNPEVQRDVVAIIEHVLSGYAPMPEGCSQHAG
jgi:hypothetical protein